MEPNLVITAAILLAIVGIAIVSLVLTGRMQAVVRFFNLELRVKAEREQLKPTALIEDSSVGRDAAAKASGDAVVRRAKIGRDLDIHGGEESSDPKA